MAIVVASGTVHFVMSAVGAAVRVAMHGTSRRTEPVEQAPAAPRARKAQPALLGKERSRQPLHHLSSCMRPPPARSEDGACGEAAMSAGLVTSDSTRGDKVWWPDIANTAPAGSWPGVIMYHVPVMWRWVCAAVDLENPRRVVNVGGEYWRTRNRNRCVIGSCEVPPRYHGVVAAAHTPARSCGRKGAAHNSTQLPPRVTAASAKRPW